MNRGLSLVFFTLVFACSDDGTSQEATGGSSSGGSTTDASSTTTADTADSTTNASAGGSSGGESDTDDGGIPACDPFEQDCAEGLKCVGVDRDGDDFYDDEAGCVPLDPDPDQVGDPCTYDPENTGHDSCDVFATCIGGDDPEDNTGFCEEKCQGSPDDPMCTDPTDVCLLLGADNFCLATCDPLVQDCPDGQGCYWDAFVGDATCFEMFEPAPIGGDCMECINCCAAGSDCVEATVYPGCASDWCCTPYCDINEGNGVCPEQDMSCVPVFEEGGGPPDLDHVGVCIVPQ